MTPAEFHNEPKEVKLYSNPRFYFVIRYNGWMLSKEGLFRWGKVEAAIPMRNGVRAKRFGWVRISLRLLRGRSQNPVALKAVTGLIG